jgi:hypothetical protein
MPTSPIRLSDHTSSRGIVSSSIEFLSSAQLRVAVGAPKDGLMKFCPSLPSCQISFGQPEKQIPRSGIVSRSAELSIGLGREHFEISAAAARQYQETQEKEQNTTRERALMVMI